MSSPKTDQRFADYFVITGLDVTSGLEPDQLSGKIFRTCRYWLNLFKSTLKGMKIRVIKILLAPVLYNTTHPNHFVLLFT